MKNKIKKYVILPAQVIACGVFFFLNFTFIYMNAFIS